MARIRNMGRACFVLAILSLPFTPGGRAAAQELADLKVDSTARKYGEKNPVQAAEQKFGLSKAGMVKLVFHNS